MILRQLAPVRTFSILLLITALSGVQAGAAPIPLSPIGDHTREFKLAIGDEGQISAIWREGTTPEVHIWYQRFGLEGSPLTPRVNAETDLCVGQLILDFEVSRGRDGNDLVLFRCRSGWIYGTTQSLWVTAYAAGGARLFLPVQIASSGTTSWIHDFAVQPRPSTGWLVAWPIFSSVYTQAVSATAGPEGEAQLIGDSVAQGTAFWVALGVSDNAAFAVWSTYDGSGSVGPLADGLVGRTLDAAGRPSGLQLDLGTVESPEDSIRSLALEGFAGDRFALAGIVRIHNLEMSEIRGASFRGDATSLAIRTLLGGTPQDVFGGEERVGYASDAKGRAWLSWSRADGASPPSYSELWQAYAPEEVPLGPVTAISAGRDYSVTSVAPDGRWIFGWPSVAAVGSEHFAMVELGSFQDGCIQAEDALCLGSNRFRATATYHDHLGRDGVGHAVALTPESGTFWFFTPANVELILKVVDACGHPDFRDFWVYASGLTDVEATLTVVDTWTGETWERSTDLGEPFPPVLDSQAFHTCDAAPIAGPGPEFEIRR